LPGSDASDALAPALVRKRLILQRLSRDYEDAPIAMRRTIYGVSSLQALVLGLKTLAAYLYGSDLYRSTELGLHGEFGGHLSIPAPSEFLNEAPFPLFVPRTSAWTASWRLSAPGLCSGAGRETLNQPDGRVPENARAACDIRKVTGACRESLLVAQG
jgi:hypothetical protein